MEPEDEVEFAKLVKSFEDVSNFVDSEFAKQNFRTKLMNMYCVVYNAATRTQVTAVDQHYVAQAQLYSRSQDLLRQYVRKHATVAHDTPARLFKEVITRWGHYKIVMRWVEKTFGYLTRYYVPHCDAKPLDFVGLSIFFDELVRHAMPSLRRSVLEMLHRERKGEDVKAADIQCGIEIFVRMSTSGLSNVYKDEFVPSVLSETAAFYREEAKSWLCSDSTTTYLEKAEQRLESEQRRCSRYFLRNLEQEVMIAAQHELLGVHQDELLNRENSGFIALLRDHRSEHLRRMFILFGRMPGGLDPMGRLLRDHCLQQMQVVIKKYSLEPGSTAEVNFVGYVTDLLDLHSQFHKLLHEQLDNNAVFQTVIREAFEYGMNQGVSSGATIRFHSCELLSLFCDSLLRGTGPSGKMTEQELDESFDRVVSLLSLVVERDVFVTHARIHLSRRLLSAVTADETERGLIQKLRGKFGAPFTSFLEGMMNDKSLSQENHQQYLQFLQRSNMTQTIDFSALVLTHGFWPKISVDELNVPSEVSAAMASFQAFYNSKTQHRVLSWVNAYGTAQVSGRFAGNVSKEFSVSLFQAAVLLSYNTQDSFTATELRDRLKMDWDELRKVLPSFTKIKLLIRTGEQAGGNTLKENDRFTINDSFQSQHRKMKIPLAHARVTPLNSQQVQHAVEEDRKPALDACLVRIMKSRRQMEHTALIGECITQLTGRFLPDPKLIKSRIEDLISREFIERVQDKPNCYRYMA